jgi:hypothetical protein
VRELRSGDALVRTKQHRSQNTSANATDTALLVQPGQQLKMRVLRSGQSQQAVLESCFVLRCQPWVPHNEHAFSNSLEQEMTAGNVEERILLLEQKVRQLENISRLDQKTLPWWEQVAGSFKDDEVYATAMKLAEEIRKADKSQDTAE